MLEYIYAYIILSIDENRKNHIPLCRLIAGAIEQKFQCGATLEVQFNLLISY